VSQVVVAGFALAGVLLTACAAPSPTPIQTPTHAPSASPAPPTLTPSRGPTAPPTAAPTEPGTPSPSPPALPSPSPAPFDPIALSLTLTPFAAGFDALTFLTHAGDGSGRLYVVEQFGRVWLLEADGTRLPEPFIDIRSRIIAGGERGLLGIAFHPSYSDNGRLFVNYTDLNGDTVVAEYARVSQTAADPASERIVLTVDQPFSNHNGGMIAFGPDGYLYVATGDGGGAGDPLDAGQDRRTRLGKLLRIDVDGGEPYAIPADNPFVDESDALPEIWAYGLRNPWRFSFDRELGTLFIADVGQSGWEEVNAAPPGSGGLNFGWSLFEGPDCRRGDCDPAGLTLPVAWYARDAGHCSVTGGYAYRGTLHPELSGAYLLADYCSGTIWGLDAAAAAAGQEVSLHELAQAGFRPTSFGEDEAGELYLVGQGGEILLIGAEPR